MIVKLRHGHRRLRHGRCSLIRWHASNGQCVMHEREVIIQAGGHGREAFPVLSNRNRTRTRMRRRVVPPLPGHSQPLLVVTPKQLWRGRLVISVDEYQFPNRREVCSRAAQIVHSRLVECVLACKNSNARFPTLGFGTYAAVATMKPPSVILPCPSTVAAFQSATK